MDRDVSVPEIVLLRSVCVRVVVERPHPESIEMVVAALQRTVFRQRAQMPLADERRAVAGPLQQRRQCGMFRRQADRRVRRGQRLLESKRQPVLIPARDQRQPRRRADRGVRIRLQKAHAVAGDAIDVRRLQIGTAVARDVGVSEIVGHDEDDIRLRRCLQGLAEDVVHSGRQRERAERGAAKQRATAYRFVARDLQASDRRTHGGIMHYTSRRSQP